MHPTQRVTTKTVLMKLDPLPPPLSFLQSDNVEKTKAFLKRQPGILNQVFSGEKTFFMLVLEEKALDVALHVLQNHAPDVKLSACDENDFTCLHYGACIPSLPLFTALLEKGASNGQKPLLFPDNTTSVLHLAAECKDSCLAQILGMRCNIDVVDQEGATSLYRAARAGLAGNVQTLLQNGANPNCGHTLPLVEAYLQNNTTCANLLLKHGASPNVKFQNVWLLELAEATDNKAFVRLLLRHNATKTWAFSLIQDANQLLQQYPPPPHPLDKEALTKMLREKQHLTEIPHDPDKNLYLHQLVATKPHYFDQIKRAALKNHWEKRNTHGETPFLYACRQGSSYSVYKFVEMKMCQRLSDTYGNTVLHLICKNPNKGLTALLIDMFSDCKEIKNTQGLTPLQVAAFHANADCIEVLLQKGANEAVLDQSQNTLLHLICHSHEKDMTVIASCITLIAEKYSALLEQKNAQGDTPLHYAIRQKNNAVINALLNLKIDLEAETTEKETPLVMAIKLSDETVTRRLVNEGSRRYLKYNRPLLAACHKANVFATTLLLNPQIETSKPADPNSPSKGKHERPLSVIIKAITEKKMTDEILKTSNEYKIFIILMMQGADPKKKIKYNKKKMTIFEYAKTLNVPSMLLQELQPTSHRVRKSTSTTQPDTVLTIDRSMSSSPAIRTVSSDSAISPSSSQDPSPRPTDSDSEIIVGLQQMSL